MHRIRTAEGLGVVITDAKSELHGQVLDKRRREALERIFDLSVDLLGTASLEGHFTLLNPAWEHTLGWTRTELMNFPFIDFVHPDDVASTAEAAAKLAVPGAAPLIGFENRYRSRSGRYVTVEWNVVADGNSLVFVAHDMTEQQTTAMAHNHSAILMQAVIENVADGLYVADCHGKITLINPAGVHLLGYESADDLLGQGPHALFHHSYPNGAPFPFAKCSLATVRITGSSIREDEDVFWRKDGSMLPVSFSSAPIELSDGTGSVVAFRDITLQQADRDRQRALVDEIERFDEVSAALTEERFVLYAQPVINIESGATLQHELLLRMLSSSGEIVEPGQFLPTAEKFGLINRIDQWVITRGFELAAETPVALNLSAESMGSLEILRHVERELTRTGISANSVTFELTETAIMKDLDQGSRFAERLVALGCTFALDDFGTGYASLTYLRKLPITYVKIDGSFVNGITRNESDSSIVEAMVHMVHSLGKFVIAEGIEDEETLNKLRSFGVDFGQGFHIGRPAPTVRPAPKGSWKSPESGA
jgi:PAS domain S-box-containing protein